MSDVVMPRLSDSMEEGTILKWLKQEGEEVAIDLVGDPHEAVKGGDAWKVVEARLSRTLDEE